MRRLTPALACLTLLLVATSPVDAWTQLGGGPGHEGAAILPPGPLDVVRSFRLVPEGMSVPNFYSQGLAVADGGLIGIEAPVEDAEGACSLLSVQDPAVWHAERKPLGACMSTSNIANETLVAYDPTRNLALSCRFTPGTESGVLVARDLRSGEPAWEVTARDLAVQPAMEEEIWYCFGAALDPSEEFVVVPFQTATPPFRSHVARIALDDGAVTWTTTIPFSVFAADANAPVGVEDAQFSAGVVTFTTTGLVLTGVTTVCFMCEGMQVGVVWTDFDGNVVGGRLAGTDGHDVAAARGSSGGGMGSDWAVSHGALALTALGDRLILINPAHATPVAEVPLASLESLEGIGFWPAARWRDDHVLVPLRHSLLAFDGRDLSPRWTWTHPDWVVADVLIAPPHDAFLLVGSRLSDGPRAALLRLDLTSGAVVQRWPLDISQGYTLGAGTPHARWYGGRILPLVGTSADGLLAWDAHGDAVLLKPAEEARLGIEGLSEPYPRPGQSVTLRLAADEDVTGYFVYWGDKTADVVESAPGTVLEYRYAEPGERILRVTAVYADNRTVTREAVVHVGGTPPVPLNAMQRAFAPEHQDTTWGVIGVSLVLLGGAWGLAQRARRAGRLSREFARLDAVRDAMHTDPAAALRDIEQHRVALRRALARGRLEESQYAVLDGRAVALARAARRRVLRTLGQKFSPRFRDALAESLADDDLSVAERRHLLDLLEREEDPDGTVVQSIRNALDDPKRD